MYGAGAPIGDRGGAHLSGYGAVHLPDATNSLAICMPMRIRMNRSCIRKVARIGPKLKCRGRPSAAKWPVRNQEERTTGSPGSPMPPEPLKAKPRRRPRPLRTTLQPTPRPWKTTPRLSNSSTTGGNWSRATSIQPQPRTITSGPWYTRATPSARASARRRPTQGLWCRVQWHQSRLGSSRILTPLLANVCIRVSQWINIA